MSASVKKLKKISKRTPRKKLKAKRCAFFNSDGKQCRRKAVGTSTLCKMHGGEKVIDEKSLVSASLRSALDVSSRKFDPERHPIEYLELAKEGRSNVEIAAEMQIAPKTLEKWAEKYKEFAYVFELGAAMQEAWWITQAKNNLTNTRFQTGLFKFLTTNKLGYAEKVETRNENINKNVGVLLVPGAMSVDEWEQNNIIEDEEDIIDVEPVREEEVS